MSQSATPAPAQQQQQQQRASPAPVDPFASLVSGGSRASSPFSAAPQSSAPQAKAPPSTLLDVGGAPSASAGAQPTAPTTTVAKESDGDEEWSFTSSLPENSLPTTNQVRVLNSSLTIDFASRRSVTNDRQIQIVALFSNATGQPLTELHFQVAVEKVKNSFFPLWQILLLISSSRRTLSNSGRSLAETFPRYSRTGSGRTWPSTGFHPAKATRSKSGSRCRIALVGC